MALTAKDWTISALAVELKRDKRTVAEIIDNSKIKPVRAKGAYKYYKLADIVNAMVGNTALDFQQEKAKESVERQRKLKIENDLKEGLLVSTDSVTEALAKVGKQIISVLDSIPLNVKKRVPVLESKDIDFIRVEISKARNTIANLKFEETGGDEWTN